MQEFRIILDLDMLHKNYKEVFHYIENLPKTFPGLVKYNSIEAHREPDKEDIQENNIQENNIQENNIKKEQIKEDKIGIPTEEI